MKLKVTSDMCQTKVTIEEQRLDAAIATRFKDQIRKIVSQCKNRIMLDMQQVDFMDSSGLGALIAVHKAMPEGVDLILCSLGPNVERVFRLTRMDTVFRVVAPTKQSRDQRREAG